MIITQFTDPKEWEEAVERAGYDILFTVRKVFAFSEDGEPRGAFDIASSTGSLQLDTQ